MTSVTVVLPDPAEIFAGVNVAVAPVGRPLMEKLTSEGKAGAAGGAKLEGIGSLTSRQRRRCRDSTRGDVQRNVFHRLGQYGAGQAGEI